MKKQHKPTVTVAIPAYNEADNIGGLLRDVIIQTEDGFVIKTILVISDGSTDSTVEKVRAIQDERVELLAFSSRRGKSRHLNEIFTRSTSDYLVLFDADVRLAYPTVIKHLVQPLQRYSEVMLVGGNPQPIKARTFIESCINLTFSSYDQLRLLHDEGHNAFGCDGRILALRKEFYASVHVPYDMIANDAYMYFSCISSGGEFRHARRAKVYYRSPSTLEDHIRQNKRFLAARKRLYSIFGDIVPQAYAISWWDKLRVFVPRLLSRPIHGFSIYLINIYCQVKGYAQETTMHAKWPMATTTKRRIG